MGAADPEKKRKGRQRLLSAAWTVVSFLFGGIGLYLFDWDLWEATSRSHPSWFWGFLGAAAGGLVVHLILRGRRIALAREWAAFSLWIACAAIASFIGLAHLLGGDETPAESLSSLPESPTTSPTAPSGSEEWTPFEPADVGTEPDEAQLDCPAIHHWEGPKTIVVDRVEIEDGFYIGGSCNGGVKAGARFPFEGDVTRFRVTAGILNDSADDGPLRVHVLAFGAKTQKLCEGTLRAGQPLELTMDVVEVTRVKVVVYLPERLFGLGPVLGVGNAEIGKGPPQGGEPSCGAAFEPKS